MLILERTHTLILGKNTMKTLLSNKHMPTDTVTVTTKWDEELRLWEITLSNENGTLMTLHSVWEPQTKLGDPPYEPDLESRLWQ